jgi:Pyruvate/2-oxoacid:ferredoxin oxidoreductase gamma subunit
VVGKKAIGSPAIENPNVLVALNRPSLEKFGPLVPEDGLIIYNSSLIDQVPTDLKGKVYALPATDLASESGTAKAANVVTLGFIAQKTGMFKLNDLEKFLSETFKKPELLETNLKAVRAGWDAAEKL